VDNFHDETAKVEAKAQKSRIRAEIVRRDQDAEYRALVLADTKEYPMITLLAPLIDQGIGYFMTHYAVGLDQPSISSKTYNQHLSTDGFHPLIATTMTALGIAGVANMYMDPGLKREATRWYLNAIKMANAAISSPQDSRSDTTLFAVNLLTLFEATSNEDSFSGWSNHVDGSSLLIKLRGTGQVKTATGRRLYLHTVGLQTINCMGKSIALPNYVNKINEEIMQYIDTRDPRTAFFFLHVKTANLRARIINHKTVDISEIIDEALQLDAEAASIFEKADPEWNYDTVPCFEKVPGVFGHQYHVYRSHSAAQTWNWVRYNRIYFHDIIRNCILAGFATSPPPLDGPKYATLLGSSTQTLQQLQADIIASMPQFLHDTPMITPRNPSQAFSSTPPLHSFLTTPLAHNTNLDQRDFFKNFKDENVDIPSNLLNRESCTHRLPLVRVSGGYSSVWALYVAGSMPTASASSQDFVLHCLDRIEREFGIMQASVFSKALRFKRQLINSGETPLSLCPQYLPPDPGDNVPYPDLDSKVSTNVPQLQNDHIPAKITHKSPPCIRVMTNLIRLLSCPAEVAPNSRHANMLDANENRRA
jgi:hypothetical protein